MNVLSCDVMMSWMIERFFQSWLDGWLNFYIFYKTTRVFIERNQVWEFQESIEFSCKELIGQQRTKDWSSKGSALMFLSLILILKLIKLISSYIVTGKSSNQMKFLKINPREELKFSWIFFNLLKNVKFPLFSWIFRISWDWLKFSWKPLSKVT